MGNKAMQAKYKRLREEAYELGRWEFERLARLPMFRDFVCLYIAEGYKKDRNTVSVPTAPGAPNMVFSASSSTTHPCVHACRGGSIACVVSG
jgi:hypothetical protein